MKKNEYMEQHNIFPIALVEFKIPLDTKKLQEDLEKYKSLLKEHPLLEGGNSTFQYVDVAEGAPRGNAFLENEEFGPLKKEFEICIEKYKELSGLRELQISNSWLNIMNKNGSLKEHRHRTSIISGAYYPKCPITSAGLTTGTYSPNSFQSLLCAILFLIHTGK